MHLCINNATSPLYAEIQQLKQENFNLKKSIGEIPKINSKLDDLEQHSRVVEFQRITVMWRY
jgi:Tfp pilus assembly protein PilN